MSTKTYFKLWRFPSSSGSGEYETLLYTDGTTSCNCMGWTRRTDGAGNRSCKHTRAVEDGHADRMANSFHTQPTATQLLERYKNQFLQNQKATTPKKKRKKRKPKPKPKKTPAITGFTGRKIFKHATHPG